jgi:hypothetical protein
MTGNDEIPLTLKTPHGRTFSSQATESRVPARCYPRNIEIDVGELLAVVIAHDKARVQFLDRPRRREAAF